MPVDRRASMRVNPTDDGDVVLRMTRVQDRAPVRRPAAEHDRRARWKEILGWCGCSTVGSWTVAVIATGMASSSVIVTSTSSPSVAVLIAALRVRRHSTTGASGNAHWARRWMAGAERRGRSASLRELVMKPIPTGGLWT